MSNVALKSFYVERGELAMRFLEGLQRAKTLRENADYYDQWSELGAKEIVNLSEEFLNKSETISKPQRPRRLRRTQDERS